jgi:hypothetical protein
MLESKLHVTHQDVLRSSRGARSGEHFELW